MTDAAGARATGPNDEAALDGGDGPIRAGGETFTVAETTERDRGEVLVAFREIVAAGEGYPQHPDDPVSAADFDAYWFAPASTTVVARSATGELAGAYTIKPNGVGRAAHVGNAGYFVVDRFRGVGLGAALVEHSFDRARAQGFDALQFNFVFASNPARRLYERLGFEVIGTVPDVIGDEAVLIYWRRL